LDDVYVRDLRTGQDTRLFETAAVWEHPRAWSRDGKYLLVHWHDAVAAGLKVWSSASRSLSPFAKSATEMAAFSPDGRYVAFSSLETGRHEVYVTTFPEGRQTWTVTSDGGRVISWRQDGLEILVATLSGHIAAYPLSVFRT
jgi:Tol biopolymer transport system component